MFQTAKDFGKAIRKERKAKGWTQVDLAVRAGTGERFIVELEAGKPSCQLDKVLQVARTLNMHIGDLRAAGQVKEIKDADELSFLPDFGDAP
jgi:HTH-type transcriptional regulator/antitoxin HipB